MCTLSWSLHPEGYSVFFNRDERNSRSVARSPFRRAIAGVDVIAPQDGDKGGSWIVVNAHGVLTCLLNLYEYPIPRPAEPYLSRGYLVMDLAVCNNWEQSQAILGGKDLHRFPPFHLVQFLPDGEVNSLKWSGVERIDAQLGECLRPLSGSSFRNDEVVAKRIETFHSYCEPDTSQEQRLRQLEQFHLSHDPEQGAYSANMCRPDARTVSLSRVDVDAKKITFQYRQKAIQCFEFEPPSTVMMDRRPAVV